MRTTITLDADLVKKLRDLAYKRGDSFTQTLNDVVRRGLMAKRAAEGRYAVEPHRGGFRPGVDLGKLNQVADELEVEDFVREASR